MKPRSAFTLIELLICLAIVAILGTLVIGGMGGCSISDGTRVGTITKFSQKGMMVKSWEGEMVLGGVRGAVQGGTVANTWQFTVLKSDLAPKVEALIGKEVKVKYHQVLIHNPVTRDTSYEILSIEEANPPQ